MKIPTPKQTKSGRWRLQYTTELPDGRTVRQSLTCDTKAECTQQYMQAIYLKNQYHDPTSGRKLTDCIDRYIEENSYRLSPSTIRGYRNMQRSHCPHLMDKPVGRIDADALQAEAVFELKNYSPKTLANVYGFIGTVIEYERGVRLRVKLPNATSPTKEFLDFEEIEIFTEAVKGDRVEIPALLALWSLRLSEIRGLQWDCVDMRRKTIRVERSMVRDEHGNFVYKDTLKTEASRRVIPMCDQLHEALSAIPKENREGLVVRMDNKIIRNGINRICEENGLPKVGIHGLRHSFASLCHHLGVPEEDAMRMGGWSDAGTMRKIYTHVSEKDIANFNSQLLNYYNKK